MIEVKRDGGVVSVLMVRTESTGPGVPSTIFWQATPRDVAAVVSAGDPAITDRLRDLGWWKPGPFTRDMADAGAELLHAATAFLTASNGWNRSVEHSAAKALREAINNYTDNVAPPEDEPTPGPMATVTAVVESFPLELRMRDVLPDEINEDPELDADETDRQLYATKSHQMDTKAELLRIQDELGVLIRALNGDEPTNRIPTVERLAELVNERDDQRREAEDGLDLALVQMGKETLARIAAQKEEERAVAELQHFTSVTDPEQLEKERYAARLVVHAAFAVMVRLLNGQAIVYSPLATALNDAIHDWLDLTPDDDAKRATCEFLEARIRTKSSKVEPPTLDEVKTAMRASGVTAEDFGRGVAMYTAAGLDIPPAPKVPTIEPDLFGSRVARGAFWLLDKLWPNTKEASK